jgi:hypothetical protein
MAAHFGVPVEAISDWHPFAPMAERLHAGREP